MRGNSRCTDDDLGHQTAVMVQQITSVRKHLAVLDQQKTVLEQQMTVLNQQTTIFVHSEALSTQQFLINIVHSGLELYAIDAFIS